MGHTVLRAGLSVPLNSLSSEVSSELAYIGQVVLESYMAGVSTMHKAVESSERARWLLDSAMYVQDVAQTGMLHVTQKVHQLEVLVLEQAEVLRENSQHHEGSNETMALLEEAMQLAQDLEQIHLRHKLSQETLDSCKTQLEDDVQSLNSQLIGHVKISEDFQTLGERIDQIRNRLTKP